MNMVFLTAALLLVAPATESVAPASPAASPRLTNVERLTALEAGHAAHRTALEALQLQAAALSQAVDELQRPARELDALRSSGDVRTAPVEFSRPGYYKLQRDLAFAGEAFIVTAANVVIDLDGHTVLYGVTGDAPYGLRVLRGDVTLRRGALQRAAQP